jgi:hypothetical protein
LHATVDPSAVTLQEEAVPTETFIVICLLKISDGKAE